MIKHLDREVYVKLKSVYDEWGGAVNCTFYPLMPVSKMLLLFSKLDKKTLRQLYTVVSNIEARGKYSEKYLNKIRKAMEAFLKPQPTPGGGSCEPVLDRD